jgi:hypothetical protein
MGGATQLDDSECAASCQRQAAHQWLQLERLWLQVMRAQKGLRPAAGPKASALQVPPPLESEQPAGHASESGTCRCCVLHSYDASSPNLPCQDHVCPQTVADRIVGAHCGGLCWGSSLCGWRLLLRRLNDAGMRLRCALLLACRNRLLLGGHLCLGGLNSCFCRCGDSSCSREFVLLIVGSLFLLGWSWLCWLSGCGVRLYRGLLGRRRLHGCCSRSGSSLQGRQTLTSSTAMLLSDSQHRQVHDAKEQRPLAVLAARCYQGRFLLILKENASEHRPGQIPSAAMSPACRLPGPSAERPQPS